MNFYFEHRVSIGTSYAFPYWACAVVKVNAPFLQVNKQTLPPRSKLVPVMAARRIGGVVLLVAVSALLVWRVQGQTSKSS